MTDCRTRRLALFCFIATIAAGPRAFAAEDPSSSRWEYKAEVFGSVSRAGFFHGDNHLGSGLDVGGGFGLRPFSGALNWLGFEANFNKFDFSKAWGDGFSNKGSGRSFTGNAVFHVFPRSRAQLFFLAGLGVFEADYTMINGYMKNQLGFSNYEQKAKATKRALDLGLGVKVRLGSRISVRPEIRVLDTTMGSGYNWGHLRYSVGVGYHF